MIGQTGQPSVGTNWECFASPLSLSPRGEADVYEALTGQMAESTLRNRLSLADRRVLMQWAASPDSVACLQSGVRDPHAYHALTPNQLMTGCWSERCQMTPDMQPISTAAVVAGGGITALLLLLL